MDIRKFRKSRLIHLRFWLSDQAHRIVLQALSLTGYEHTGAALDAVAMNFLSGSPPHKLGAPAKGRNRFLVRLFPDQWECVEDALKMARQGNAADALVVMCERFVDDHG